MIAETERGLAFLQAKTARSSGRRASIAASSGAAELRRLEPHLDGRFLGGAYCPGRGQDQPLGCHRSRAAGGQRRRRARVIVSGAAVRANDAGGRGRFTIETVTRRNPRHRRVVNAAGAFANEIGAMLSAPVPVFGAPLADGGDGAGGAAWSRASSPIADRHLTLKQAANGSLIIGGGWTAGLDPVHGAPRPIRASLEGQSLGRAACSARAAERCMWCEAGRP